MRTFVPSESSSVLTEQKVFRSHGIVDLLPNVSAFSAPIAPRNQQAEVFHAVRALPREIIQSVDLDKRDSALASLANSHRWAQQGILSSAAPSPAISDFHNAAERLLNGEFQYQAYLRKLSPG